MLNLVELWLFKYRTPFGWPAPDEAWQTRSRVYIGRLARNGKMFYNNPSSFFRFIKNPGSFSMFIKNPGSLRIRIHFSGSLQIQVQYDLILAWTEMQHNTTKQKNRMGCRRVQRTVSAFHVGRLSATVLLLGFESNLICDPAIILLSRAAMRRNNKWKTTAQSLRELVTKEVHPTQLLYLIQTGSARSVGTYLPIFL